MYKTSLLLLSLFSYQLDLYFFSLSPCDLLVKSEGLFRVFSLFGMTKN
jgi:hypothetical protein